VSGRRLGGAVVLATLLLSLVLVGGADAGGAAPVAPAPPRRLLVLSLPTLAWSDLYQGNSPHLDRLLDGSAVAALSVRDVSRRTRAGDGYAAISAGTRARGVDDSGQVLGVGERIFGVSAADAYRRNTGHAPGHGIVDVAQAEVVRSNKRLHFGAEIGALGQALEDAHVPRAVIANADSRAVDGERIMSREAGQALADSAGRLPDGDVSPDLLQTDVRAPFGLRFDQGRVVSAFEAAWAKGGAVLVEGSDLARADRYRSNASANAQLTLRQDAVRATDALVGRLLAHVDLDHDPVLVVGPYHSSVGAHLTVAGLHAPGVAPGLLRSASTRRAGFVTLVDIAPTILDQLHVERPDSMEGRPFTRTARGAATGAERASDLVRTNRQAKFRDHMVAPVATLFVALQALLLLAAVWAGSRRGSATWVRWVSLAALALILYLPATYLAGQLPFYRWGEAAYYGFVVALAVALGALAAWSGRGHRLDPLIVALGILFTILVVDMVIGAPLQLNTVFGYSPTVGGRFSGMGNLAYGMFAGAAFLLAGLLVHRIPNRRRAVALAIGILALAVLIDGSPIWGSDVGGVLAFVPAIGLTATLLLRVRIRVRVVALWLAATAVAIGAFALYDLSRPSDSQTHLGRLVESINSEGSGSFATVVARKLGANLGVITSTVWTAMVPLALVLAVYLLARAPGKARAIRAAIPEVLAGLLVVGFLGFALNDSGIAVPGVMIGVVNSGLIYLALRGLPESADP
jgi:hypothetical protein